MRALITFLVLMLTADSASADTAPLLVSSSPWAAIAILAVVIGMMAGIIIWRHRR